jgi:hypothetical protein
MPNLLINLHHHGAAGWTWAVHHPGRVTVWRTDETGHGLHQQVATAGTDIAGRPSYEWVTRDPADRFTLPADRAGALATLRATFRPPAPRSVIIDQRAPVTRAPAHASAGS